MLVVVGRLADGTQGLHRGPARRRVLDTDVRGGGGPVEDLRGRAQVRLPVLVRERGRRRGRGGTRGRADRVSGVDDGFQSLRRRRGEGEGDESRNLEN